MAGAAGAYLTRILWPQFPVTAIREIKILKVLNHKNVVQLKEIVTSKGARFAQGGGGTGEEAQPPGVLGVWAHLRGIMFAGQRSLQRSMPPHLPVAASEYNHGKGSIYMVMEFSDHDLTGLTDAGTRFTTPQIKCYMKQLLEGLAYCHKNRVLHRDIKGPRPVVRSDGMWGEGAPLAARQEAGRSTPLPCARRLQPPDQQPGATEAGRFRLGEAV